MIIQILASLARPDILRSWCGSEVEELASVWEPIQAAHRLWVWLIMIRQETRAITKATFWPRNNYDLLNLIKLFDFIAKKKFFFQN
jgi:hypothetical protein